MSRKPVIPSWARPVDDTLATQKKRGYMGPQDKKKLDELVPGSTLTASDPLVIVGSAIDIKPSSPTQEGSISAADKAKLDALAPGAQANVLEDVTLGSATGAVAVTNGGAGGIVGKVKALTFTIATAVAGGLAGLMSGADKTKLDGVEPLAQVNTVQTIGGIGPMHVGPAGSVNKTVSIDDANAAQSGAMPAASVTKLQGVAAGAQVNLLEDVTLASATTAVAVGNGGAGGIVGKVKALTFTIANAVAGGAAGLFSGADKAKLDGVSAGAQANLLEDVTLASATTAVVVGNGGAGGIVGKVKPLTLDVALVSASAAGLISAADKAKLDGIPPGGGGGTSLSADAPVTYDPLTGHFGLAYLNPLVKAAAGPELTLQNVLGQRVDAIDQGATANTAAQRESAGGLAATTFRNPNGNVHLASGTGGIGTLTFIDANGSVYLCGNCTFDGTNWVRTTAGQTAAILVWTLDGRLLRQVKVAGPATWTTWDTTATLDNNQLTFPDSGGQVGRVTRLGGPQEDMHLRSGDAAGSYVFTEARLNNHMCANAYWDGTNWQRFDPALPSAVLNIRGDSATAREINLWYAAPGSGPVTFITIGSFEEVASTFLQVRADKGGMMLAAADSVHLTANLRISQDGSVWNRFNTGAAGAIVVLGPGGTCALYTAPAGVNPAALTLVGTFSLAQWALAANPPRAKVVGGTIGMVANTWNYPTGGGLSYNSSGAVGGAGPMVFPKFTAPVAGIYSFSFEGYYDRAVNITGSFRINGGGTYGITTNSTAPFPANNLYYLNLQSTFDLAAGSYVEPVFWPTVLGNFTTVLWTGQYVGPI